LRDDPPDHSENGISCFIGFDFLAFEIKAASESRD